MGITFVIPHEIDTTYRAGWLWYSHADLGNGPTDRQVLSGVTDSNRPGVRYANHYFLSDQALQVLNGTNYLLGWSGMSTWFLTIDDPGRAALFKLRFL